MGDATCSNNLAFTDVWMSSEVTTGGITSDIGTTWTCQTANYDPSFTSTYTKGIGKYVSSVITHDDVLWMMGGQVPNTTTGLNTVYTSYAGPLDLSLSKTVYAQYPLASATGLGLSTSVTMYFTEDVVAGTGKITITDLGNDAASGGTTANADAAIAITTAFSRQMLTITPSAALKTSHKYTVALGDGSIKDLAGNTFTSFSFTVTTDGAAPTVSSASPSGANVGPSTNILLTTSESVVKGTGAITLACAVGANDTAAPTFVSMYPPVGATDVPASNITATMLFSEPVKFNASGFISILNSSSKVIASVNLTKD